MVVMATSAIAVVTAATTLFSALLDGLHRVAHVLIQKEGSLMVKVSNNETTFVFVESPYLVTNVLLAQEMILQTPEK